MITFQEETYIKVKDDIKALLFSHWEELRVLNSSQVLLEPNWDIYKFLFDKNSLHIVTARDNKKLIGYYISIITPLLHYKNTLAAENDVLYLQKKYRKGLTGYKLIKFAIKQLKQRVKVIIFGMKVEHTYFPVAKRLGFELTEYKFTLEV